MRCPEHPLLFAALTSVFLCQNHRKTEQIRALISALHGKALRHGKAFQIFRPPDSEIVVLYPEDQNIRSAFLMPEHLRVTIIGSKSLDHLSVCKLPVFFNQGVPAIRAVCQTNRIGFPFTLLRRVPGCRVKEKQCVLRQSKKFMIIPDGTAGEHRTVLIRLQGIPKIFPMQQVFSSCMSPGHAVPVDSSRIVLIIHFINSIVINKPVGIIHPAVRRRKMKRRPVHAVLFFHLFSLSYFMHSSPSVGRGFSFAEGSV